MPVGATIGVGVLGAGASIIGGMSQSDAISDASDAQSQASAQATALQREIYGNNVAIQQPFLNTGMAAMGNINALLGLNVPNTAAGGAGGALGGQTEDQWAQGALNALRAEVNPSLWSQVNGIQDPSDRLAALEPLMFRRDREAYGQFINRNPRPLANQPGAGGALAQVDQPTAQQAFDAFRNSTGYNFRVGQANDAFNSRAAGTGTLQSGAAIQARDAMNQNLASGEFGNYFNMLAGQQQLGPGAANALAGVGTNYANNAGNIAMQNGNNMGAAAIAQGNNTSNMINGIGSAVGGAMGGIFGGSSFGNMFPGGW